MGIVCLRCNLIWLNLLRLLELLENRSIPFGFNLDGFVYCSELLLFLLITTFIMLLNRFFFLFCLHFFFREFGWIISFSCAIFVYALKFCGLNTAIQIQHCELGFVFAFMFRSLSLLLSTLAKKKETQEHPNATISILYYSKIASS